MKFLDAVAKVDELAKDNIDCILCTVREEYYKSKGLASTTTPIFGYYSQSLEPGYDYYADVKNITPQDLLKDDYIILEYIMDKNNFNRIMYKYVILDKSNKVSNTSLYALQSMGSGPTSLGSQLPNNATLVQTYDFGDKSE